MDLIKKIKKFSERFSKKRAVQTCRWDKIGIPALLLLKNHNTHFKSSWLTLHSLFWSAINCDQPYQKKSVMNWNIKLTFFWSLSSSGKMPYRQFSISLFFTERNEINETQKNWKTIYLPDCQTFPATKIWLAHSQKKRSIHNFLEVSSLEKL